MPQSKVLTVLDCWSRLRSCSVGRIGYTAGGVPGSGCSASAAGAVPDFRVWSPNCGSLTIGGAYQGLYEWDDPAAAEMYALTLWRALALVSVPGSIDYRVLPRIHRADLFETIHPDAPHATGAEWWRVTGVVLPGGRVSGEEGQQATVEHTAWGGGRDD